MKDCAACNLAKGAGLMVPYSPAEELLSAEHWPIADRISAIETVPGSASSEIGSPWFDLRPNDSPVFASRAVAAVMAREFEVGVYWELPGASAVTFATIDLVIETLKLGLGGQPVVAQVATMETVDLMAFLSGVYVQGYFDTIEIAARFVRFRVVYTTSALSGTAGRLALWVAYQKMRRFVGSCPEHMNLAKAA